MGTSETRHRLRGNLNRIKCPRPLDTMSQARNLKLFIIYSRSILKTIEMICVWPVARVEGGHVLLLPPDGDVAHPVLPLQDRLLLWVQPTSAHRVSRLILAQRSLLSGVTSRLARRTWRSKYILKFHVSMILECLFFAITAAPFRCQSLTAHLCSILCPRPVCLSSEGAHQSITDLSPATECCLCGNPTAKRPKFIFSSPTTNEVRFQGLEMMLSVRKTRAQTWNIFLLKISEFYPETPFVTQKVNSHCCADSANQ